MLATDAPLSAMNLERLARRAVLGLARTGSYMGNGSGDFVIAFSTRNPVDYAPGKPARQLEELENNFVSPLFLAAVEAVEDAVYNSLLKATTVTGTATRWRRSPSTVSGRSSRSGDPERHLYAGGSARC